MVVCELQFFSTLLSQLTQENAEIAAVDKDHPVQYSPTSKRDKATAQLQDWGPPPSNGDHAVIPCTEDQPVSSGQEEDIKGASSADDGVKDVQPEDISLPRSPDETDQRVHLVTPENGKLDSSPSNHISPGTLAEKLEEFASEELASEELASDFTGKTAPLSVNCPQPIDSTDTKRSSSLPNGYCNGLAHSPPDIAEEPLSNGHINCSGVGVVESSPEEQLENLIPIENGLVPTPRDSAHHNAILVEKNRDLVDPVPARSVKVSL